MINPTEFGYGDFAFSWGDHICAIFDDHDQQMKVMGAFIAAGIQAEQRCVWVASEDSSNALRHCLLEMEGDPSTLEASGQLLIIPEAEFYLRRNVFDPERIRELLGVILRDNQKQGYTSMRMANDVSWLTREKVDADGWEAFETQMTEEIRTLPVALVCQYDRHQVSGDIVIAALRTHPWVILGDQFRQNPFYLAATLGTDSSSII